MKKNLLIITCLSFALSALALPWWGSNTNQRPPTLNTAYSNTQPTTTHPPSTQLPPTVGTGSGNTFTGTASFATNANFATSAGTAGGLTGFNLATIVTNRAQVANSLQSGVNEAFSTSYALPLSSPNWWFAANSYLIVSCAITNGSYLFNQEATALSFISYPFAVPAGASNVVIKFTAFALSGSPNLRCKFNTNAAALGAEQEFDNTLSATPTTYSVTNFLAPDEDGMVKFYPGAAAFCLSNVQITFQPPISDPVIGSGSFKHYDVLKKHYHNSAWRGLRPLNASEGSSVTFFTDASSVTLDISGDSAGTAFALAVYTNQVFCCSFVNDVTNGTWGYGKYYNLLNVALPSNQVTRVDVHNSFGQEPNDSSAVVEQFPPQANMSKLLLRSVFVPANNSVTFKEYPEEQRTIFVFGDSLTGSGGGFINGVDNSVWPLVERLCGVNVQLFAAGYWSLGHDFLNSRSNFWQAVRSSKATDYWLAIGHNDLGANTSTNQFAAWIDQCVTGIHQLAPGANIFLQGILTNSAEATPNSSGAYFADYRNIMAAEANLHPDYCLYFLPNLSTSDLSGGLHPTAAGNAKYAAAIANVLGTFFPTTDPVTSSIAKATNNLVVIYPHVTNNAATWTTSP